METCRPEFTIWQSDEQTPLKLTGMKSVSYSRPSPAKAFTSSLTFACYELRYRPVILHLFGKLCSNVLARQQYSESGSEGDILG